MIQDSSGVVFRALDTETNLTVAVRRFFPFGANGGGLLEDEQTAYAIAIERLAGISHPALRAVIGGGCDPVDGMPYIATEWIEGPQLESIIERGPLDPVQAASLLSKALEVCELLSEVLAEEAVWVETSLQAIVVGDEGSGRGVTFWIAPLKWLGKNDGQRGLQSIITLTEEIMGWSGKTVADQAGNGLGGWLKWLRGKARTTTLHEAREMLAAFVGAESPVPRMKPGHQATRPRGVLRKKKTSSVPIIIGAALALTAISGGGYLMIKRNNAANTALAMPLNSEEGAVTQVQPPTMDAVIMAPPPAPNISTPRVVPAAAGERSVGQVNREAAEFLASQQNLEQARVARRLEIQQRGNLFEVGDRELLLENKGSEVQLGGRLAEVRFSGSGATLYLEFSKSAAKDEPRGYIMKKDLTAEMSEESLRKFIGKRVSLRGKVNTPSFQGRPEIEIKNLAAIQEAK